ncbi:hypothetical protein [Flavihumibacter fluvii]|uniref:hypothetical protein n=1 Tax=Flavihumibacter fluvii TaxID=2838157 RepID=UPI001BDF5144|nr:hypothetical protein [Flavihumibacter fluvii]ULQ51046.1 hypothetical protein KJS93_13225 [Flavihumibacter fluvii]
MKKLVIAATLLLAITGIGFAQTTPAAKPASKTEPARQETSTKHHNKTQSSKKKTTTQKDGAEKKK